MPDNINNNMYARVDDRGRLVLPADLLKQYGFKPDQRLRLTEDAYGVKLLRSAQMLARLYIEPTNLCNLNCTTCQRNVWQEPMGLMTEAVFQKILEGIRELAVPPTVFWGGFGEPLLHPRLFQMTRELKALGSPVEMITNGTLLKGEKARELIESGIDILWVSIDGASPESYADVRLGAQLPAILENLRELRQMINHYSIRMQLGIEFVAMKHNIRDLPAVRDIASSLGVNRLLVTNVLPYSEDMIPETLYQNALGDTHYQQPEFDFPANLPFKGSAIYHFEQIRSQQNLNISLPRMDIDEDIRAAIAPLMEPNSSLDWGGGNFRQANNRCPFIERGAGVVAWDGSFSPCLPLMHNCTVYLRNTRREIRKYVPGNLNQESLSTVWNKADHLAFRQRVQDYDFPPCVLCGGCELVDDNETDCFGNPFPTCGGCLWGQGFIRCP